MKCEKCGLDKVADSFITFERAGRMYGPKCDECRAKNREKSKKWREAQALKKRHSILETEKAEVKTCRGCEVELPISNFATYWHKQMDCYVHQSKCRDCQKKAMAEWRKNNREKRKEYIRAYEFSRRNTPDGKIRNLAQKLKPFGLTLEQFNAMMERCGGKCEICGGTDFGRSKRPHIDHCHKTGKVRGLLCLSCNQVLGRFEDSAERLRRAADYLEQRK